MLKRLFIPALLFCFCHTFLYGLNLSEKIMNVIKEKEATVGVAIINGNDTITTNNETEYPTMSVFKFHIALTVLEKMRKENIPLDSMICLKKENILKNTYSPLRDKFPDQDINLSLADILDYTIRISDNNTCDWLIDFAGGIGNVDAYIRSLGITGFSFTKTEANMHEDIMCCYDNWSAPLSVAILLKKIYTESILSEEHFHFLETSMINCASGKNKLIAGLPTDVCFAHKTGSSDRRPDGVKISDGDAGVIYLPGGKKCYIVAFVKDSKESDDDNARIMADICYTVYDTIKTQD